MNTDVVRKCTCYVECDIRQKAERALLLLVICVVFFPFSCVVCFHHMYITTSSFLVSDCRRGVLFHSWTMAQYSTSRLALVFLHFQSAHKCGKNVCVCVCFLRVCVGRYTTTKMDKIYTVLIRRNNREC